jgi:hypothetical protein
MREARPDQKLFREQLKAFIVNCRFENCLEQKEYIQSMRLK